jgi:hypothetical protein
LLKYQRRRFSPLRDIVQDLEWNFQSEVKNRKNGTLSNSLSFYGIIFEILNRQSATFFTNTLLDEFSFDIYTILAISFAMRQSWESSNLFGSMPSTSLPAKWFLMTKIFPSTITKRYQRTVLKNEIKYDHKQEKIIKVCSHPFKPHLPLVS